MKKIGLATTIITIISMVFGACEKSELPSDKPIEGIYIGTITNLDNQKSKAYDNILEDATVEVIKIGNSMIEVQLYNTEMDTTFILNYFDNMDNVRVCLAGNDFKETYGHEFTPDHISRGMVGHIQNNETEWMHHLMDEHQPGDEHFGAFDTENNSFSYPFSRMEDGITQNMLFEGKKF